MFTVCLGVVCILAIIPFCFAIIRWRNCFRCVQENPSWRLYSQSLRKWLVRMTKLLPQLYYILWCFSLRIVISQHTICAAWQFAKVKYCMNPYRLGTAVPVLVQQAVSIKCRYVCTKLCFFRSFQKCLNSLTMQKALRLCFALVQNSNEPDLA